MSRYEIIQQTKDDAIHKLKLFRYCNIVRPTGFGKTYILSEIASSGFWDPVVYIYPRDIIKNDVQLNYEEKLRGRGVQFVSYQEMCAIYKLQMDLYDRFKCSSNSKILFMFDESHFIGAKLWSEGFRYLEDYFKNGYFVGATANPVRTDRVDVTEQYFHNITCFDYTANDAIKDGIYKRPIYVLAPIDVKDEANAFLKNEKENGEYSSEEEKKVSLKNIEKQLVSLVSEANISAILSKYLAEESKLGYMKFIVFYSRYRALYENYTKIEDAFKSAFNDMNVYSTIVGNDKAENKDLDRLELLHDDGTRRIDLIHCVDKLTYGYHIKDLTGVILFRYTDSDIITGQQTGRVFNISSDRQSYIFDFVGNLRRMQENKFYSVNKITPCGIAKRGISNSQLLDIDSVQLIDYSEKIETLILSLDSRRVHRKSGVYKLLLQGIMPPEVACKELYLSSSEELYALLKADGVYKDFKEICGVRFPHWEYSMSKKKSQNRKRNIG